MILNRIVILLLYVASILLFASSLIHFTSLRHKAPVDPIGIITLKISTPRQRQYNLNQANYHIGESEKILKWLKQQGAGSEQTQAHGGNAHAQTYNDMLVHNAEATKFMLMAEDKGADLEKEGLIKRLCDTLREQYVLITGKDPRTINESDTLNSRVNQGEDLQTVFSEIQEQLEFAMSW